MSVLDAARNVAADNPGGAKALALRMDKNPFTFMHELAGAGTAKLGLRDAVKMSALSGDMRILNAFAEECGCLVLKLPESLLERRDGEVMLDLAAMAKEFADVVQEVGAGMADNSISDNELSRIKREWSELVAAGQHLVVRMSEKNASDKPAHLRAVERTA